MEYTADGVFPDPNITTVACTRTYSGNENRGFTRLLRGDANADWRTWQV